MEKTVSLETVKLKKNISSSHKEYDSPNNIIKSLKKYDITMNTT